MINKVHLRMLKDIKVDCSTDVSSHTVHRMKCEAEIGEVIE